jgi:hypothetical protein
MNILSAWSRWKNPVRPDKVLCDWTNEESFIHAAKWRNTRLVRWKNVLLSDEIEER